LLIIHAKEKADKKALNETYACKSEEQHLVDHSLTSSCHVRVARPELLARSTADFQFISFIRNYYKDDAQDEREPKYVLLKVWKHPTQHIP
jgi:hypothetical protein